MRERSWRTVAAVGGLLGLVGVVAVAAAGHAPAGGESRPSADAPTLIKDYLITIELLFFGAGGVLLVFALFARRRYQVDLGLERPGGVRSLVRTVIIVAAVLIIVTRVQLDWLRKDNPVNKGAKPTATSKDKAAANRVQRYEPQFRWVPVFVVGSLIVGIGGAMAVMAVRRKREELQDAPVAVALSEVLAATLDDLRREVDPRRAVIRAYARMEQTMAAKGLPRRDTEAPLEYLARVLDAVQASAHSVSRLTQLFQRARFSTLEIDAGMKKDAIDALTGLRAELEAGR